MFERIEKQYLGLYIAVYACEMGELGDLYLGYYKIFGQRPRSFWDHGHVAADTAGTLSSTAQRALDYARDLAEQKIRSLVSAEPLRPAAVRRPCRSPVARRRSDHAFERLNPVACAH